MDVAGDNQLNVEHEMIKQRLTKHGLPIGNAGVEIIGEVFFVKLYHGILLFLSLFSLKTSRVPSQSQTFQPISVVLATVLKLIK